MSVGRWRWWRVTRDTKATDVVGNLDVGNGGDGIME